MTALIIIFSVIAVIFLILQSKIQIRFIYKDEAKVELRYLFLRFDAEELYKKIKSRNKKKKSQDAEKKESATPKKRPKGDIAGFIRFIKHITHVAVYAAKLTLERTYVFVKSFKIKIASSDASHTALMFGAANTAANGLFAALDKFSHLKYDNDNISLSPDFTSETSSAELFIIFKIKIISLIVIYLKSYMEFLSDERIKK